MLCTCQAGYEELLAREMAGSGCKEAERGPGWVRFGGEPAVESAFTHLALIEPVEIRQGTVNGLAQGVLEAFSQSLRGERVDAEWPEIWLGPAEIPGLGRRIASVQSAFDELLRRKLSRVARLGRGALPRGIGPTRGLFAWFGDFDRVWFSRAAHVNGQRRMADDPAAPSRSYLKVEEAYLLLGREPRPGESVADLGAAPGGWSYSAARRGARVTAVDNGPLKGGAADNSQIEQRRVDAFGYSPEPGMPFDWLFCDLVEEPHHVLNGICGPWLQNRWCRNFIVNLKFGRVDPVAFLSELRAPASPFARARLLRIRHLYHDREEFTVAGAAEE